MLRKLLLAATALAVQALWQGAAQAQPVTGLYIGAGGGANFMERQRIESVSTGPFLVPSQARVSYGDVGYVGVASVGYGFGNGLRLEVEGDYRYNRRGSSGAVGQVSQGGREEKYGGMVNALFDLDIGSPYVFPYVGGGAGYEWVAQRNRLTTNVGGVVSRSVLGGTDASFAYQAIAGLSFPVPPVVGLSLTAEYRYHALAGDRTYGQTVTTGATTVSSRVKTSSDYNHSLMIGLHYAFNVAPPAVAGEPPPPAAVREAARTYLVFFDWDRADLTDRARQIVAEAAQATTRVQVTRIEVSGHTDKSGTPRYNQGLSVRRAQNVAAELVRLGVPRGAITTQGFGESRPLVPTADGVREPQNRRVEIVLR